MATNGVTLREKRCWWNVNFGKSDPEPQGKGYPKFGVYF